MLERRYFVNDREGKRHKEKEPVKSVLIAGTDVLSYPFEFPLTLHSQQAWTFTGELPSSFYRKCKRGYVIGLSTRSQFGQIGFDCDAGDFSAIDGKFQVKMTNLNSARLRLGAPERLRLGKVYALQGEPIQGAELHNIKDAIHHQEGKIDIIAGPEECPYDLLSIPTPYRIHSLQLPKEIDLMDLPPGTQREKIRTYLAQEKETYLDPDAVVFMEDLGITLAATGEFRLPRRIALLIVGGVNNGVYFSHTSSRLLMPTDPGGNIYTHPIIAEYRNHPGGRAIDNRMLCVAYPAAYHGEK